MSHAPGILTGKPLFGQPIPVARPTCRADDALMGRIRAALESGMLTNGTHVSAFEAQAADYLGVEAVVAVASCTTGLTLLLACLDVHGEAVMPSFTFMATGHAATWNGLAPVFADCDPDTWNLDPSSADAALSARSSVLMGVHTFGSPCDVDGLEALAVRRGIPLVIDAAHGFGSTYASGQRVGTAGVAEVFSLSPTKTLTAGEGGLVATRDAKLARELRIAREYGNPGNYDPVLAGLNGRMTEVAALVGSANLVDLPRWLARRRELAARYAAQLAQVPGIRLQRVVAGATSVYKDLTIAVDAEIFGLTRDELAAALTAENIATRAYFDPPLHRQTIYRRRGQDRVPLRQTERLAATVLTLPLYSHMPAATVDQICEAVTTAYVNRHLIAERLRVEEPRAAMNAATAHP